MTLKSNGWPLVSIHFPTFNHERFFRSAIESALKGNYKNIEICISDDSSTDGTATLIKEYAKRFPKIIKYQIQEKNLGMAENLNYILSMCKGEYICFLSGDDVYARDKIEKQVSMFLKYPDLKLCGHYTDIIDESGAVIGQLSNRFRFGKGFVRWFEKGALYPAVSIMVRKEAVPACGFDARIPGLNDQKFWIDCLKSNGEYRQIGENLASYRKTKNGFTSNPLRGLSEIPLLYEILALSYPDFKAEIKRGLANNYTYGMALHLRNSGDLLKSSRLFLKSYVDNPRNFKAIARLIQNILIYLRKSYE